MNELTKSERAELLKVREADIEQGCEAYLKMGRALMDIKESRLYRDNHKTFEEYLQVCWNTSPAYASRVIQATKIADRVNAALGYDPKRLPIGNKAEVPPMTKESQGRAMNGVPEEAQPEIWLDAVESNGGKEPTAKQVLEKANLRFPKAKKRETKVAEPEEQKSVPEIHTNPAKKWVADWQGLSGSQQKAAALLLSNIPGFMEQMAVVSVYAAWQRADGGMRRRFLRSIRDTEEVAEEYDLNRN